MENEIIPITVYDKRLRMSTTIYVQQLAENHFRATENEIFNCRLVPGAEFETRVNEENRHEIVRFIKDSDYTTRRFILNSQFTESEYRLLGDEIIKHGGFWQVDFNSIATINLPKDCQLNISEYFKMFNFHPIEIVD